MRTVVLLILIVFAAPAAARAATASVDYSCDRYGCGAGEVTYELDPGERSTLTITGGGDGVLLRDPTVTLRPGNGCVLVEPDALDCARRAPSCELSTCTPPVNNVVVRLGRASDAVDASALSTTHVAVSGGGGRDRFTGGGGGDSFEDGDRRAGAVDADVFTGGDGTDRVSYLDRRSAVRVDLVDPGRDGQKGERDALRGVEGLTGGRGDDFLRVAGPAILNDGGGDDVMHGSPGADSIFSSGGRDVISAGGGDDEISLGRTRARVTCGQGRDTVISPGRTDVLSRCDLLSIEEGDSPYVTLALDTALRVADADCPDGPCGRIAIRARGRELASRPLRSTYGQTNPPPQVLRVPRNAGVVDVRLTVGGKVYAGFGWRVPRR